METAPQSVEELLDEIESRLVALADSDVNDVGGVVLARRLTRMEKLRARLDAAETPVLARFDAEQMANGLGYRTTKAWLAHRTHMAGATASRRVKVARSLPQMPLVAAEFTAGRFSLEQAAVFAGALNPRTEEAMGIDEAQLIKIAHRLTVDQLASELHLWRQGVDQDGTEPDKGYQSRRFQLSQGFNGDWYGTLDLGSADGAFVHAAIEAMSEEQYRQEQKDVAADPSLARTPGQRKADALVELVRRGLATNPDTATAAKVALTLMITVEDLESDRSAHTHNGTRVDGPGVDRLTCDCDVNPIGWDTNGVPLSHGRTKRLPTPAQRRTAIAQHGGCIVPGCDAPPTWAQIHHVLHWKRHHGRTDQDNLVPACTFHHPCFHEGGWTLHIGPDGNITITLPNGNHYNPEPGWN